MPISNNDKTRLRSSLLLYAVSDSQWLKVDETLYDAIEQAIRGGVSFVQVREKHMDTDDLIELAKPLVSLCDQHKVPFVINDDIRAAKKLGVGVHIGQDDASLKEARELLGDDAIIGVSVQTLEQAQEAQASGADYLGIGSLVFTPTKPDAKVLSIKQASQIARAVDIPTVAIGGINLDTLDTLSGTFFDGIAVVSAIFKSDDKQQAAKELRCKVQQILAR
ncbi:MAG: thiamine phosphate synthase [Coriobacteriia bacterium]|nr:thiamine phosphate synthase [Coriobacteriia bacterium]